MTAIVQSTIVYTANGVVVPVSNTHPLPVSISNVSLSLGNSISVTGNVGIVGQVTVANATNFQVYVENFPTTSNVSVVNNTTVNGLRFDSNSALIVNAGVISGGVSGYAQGSNTAGQIGPLIQGAVRSDTETLTNATTSPLQLDQYGNLKTKDFSSYLIGGTTPEFATAFGFVNGSSTFEVVSPSNPLPISDLSVGAVNGSTTPAYASQIGFSNLYTSTYVGVDNAFNPLPAASMANATATAPNFTGAPTSIQMLSMDLNGNLRVVTSGNGVVSQSNASLLHATVANAANFQVFVENFPTSLGSNVVTLASGSNAIGSITNTSFNATQSNSAALLATVSNAANFQVSVTNFPASSNVSVVGNTTIQGSVSIIGGSASNPAAGTIGATAPTYGGYTAFANATGYLTGVSSTVGLPVNVISGGSSGGGNAAASNTGSAVPAAASYTGFYSSGLLVGVSNTAPMPVTAYSVTSQTQVNPTITASSAYTAGYVVGGKLTFSNVVRGVSGVIQSATITCKSVQTSGFKLYLFTTNPTNSTWTDKAAPAINSADVQYLLDVVNFPSYDSGLGTMTIYTADNVGRAFNANSSTLYGILVCTSTPTFSSTSDLFIDLTILED
jgi:hypothetical protein